MSRLAAFAVLAGLCLLLPVAAHAQRIDQSPQSAAPPGDVAMVNRIAAIVNDNVITTMDLEARTRLAMLSSGLPESPEVIHRLLPQVLRGLIDEQLELQEAKHDDVTVSPQEIDNAVKKIETDNNIPGGMKNYLESHGIPFDTLRDQLRGVLSWNKVIQRELRPRVEVGDDEVDAAIERIHANAGKEEYHVDEIFLAVDSPKDEDQVRQFGDNLVQQLKQGGNFGNIARQFSQGTGATEGGDIGWVQEGQWPAELNRALVAMQVGDIEGPIRSANGFHILKLVDKRTIAAASGGGSMTLALQQAFKPYDGGGPGALQQEAERIRTAINGCANLEGQMTSQFPGWHVQDMGTVELGKIPGWIADKVREVPAGKASDPVATPKGALVFFVCEKHVPEGGIDRGAIISQIGTEKLELQARRLLRDLRQDAYLDIRLGKPDEPAAAPAPESDSKSGSETKTDTESKPDSDSKPASNAKPDSND
jgi:peptidyl-prolyl cis-trans isomerase SurA